MKPQIKSILKRSAPLLVLTIAGSAATAQAFTFQTPWPPSPMGTDIQAHPTLDYGIKYLYEWGIGLGGVAVFVVLVMAGFQYITSVGDPTKMKEAFRRIEDAVIGLLILLSSWAILNFVGLNLSSIKITMFTPQQIDPTKTCTGVEGEPANECCQTTDKNGNTVNITNCNPNLWTCTKGNGTDKGTCQPNTKTQTCTKVKIYYDNNSSVLEIGPGKTFQFNQKVPLATSKTVSKLERWYDDNGQSTLCFDPTNKDAKDASIHKPCDCNVQLLTKISSTQTGGTNTDQCSNTSGNVFVVNTADFVSNDNSVKIVCVLVYSPQ